ncbi:glyoxylase-like metal-dependent hydrolase (beta-lactamase superfamily II) [Krasilnikovia cinnamomea]|uniref:Glyoxylase-like metal-dependent hydrolase (Beta-lactamase superfamily II) n=1 Tax=Krasilnikovia cinnamomea TaxID=349313 RepID=A0A4Q7ZT98_9ACTN|nr:MBL fold metallo-hydrolase [Krasilnikovia cinnamomea]RZU53749.1 glyoxylase-like metal-dependent hydrolase (beta-lactamase superfamily II) [Krasilnikovia cinnamomea]
MTVEITGTAQWQAWRCGALPGVERVREGLWSVPVPIPDNPLRYVLVYALEAADGLVLIDAGWDADASWAALNLGLAEIGAAVGDVRAVLVTHHHADHLGLAGRIREASGAWIAIHRLDAPREGPDRHSPASWRSSVAENMVRHGTPRALARSAAAAMDAETFLDAAAPDVTFEDGERIRLPGVNLQVVWTPGHSPGHSCFYEPQRRLLFSGDHVLPRITPQVAVYAGSRSDPLADFLDSLGRLEEFDVEEVLPAHEYRFRGLSPRLADMAEHHVRRLLELRGAVEAHPGSTAWELAGRLLWSRPWETFSAESCCFALAETLAHLIRLENRGEVRSTALEPVRWFRR